MFSSRSIFLNGCFLSVDKLLIFSSYSFLSITMKQLPLSAFMITLVLSFLSSFKAFLSSRVVLCAGKHDLSRMLVVEVRIESQVSSERSLMTSSISATMFLYGILFGVMANLGPFSRI